MFDSQWTVPPPPITGDRPIRGRKVAAGIGVGIAGHLLAIGLTVLAAYLEVQSNVAWVWIGMGAEVVLFVACLIFGTIWIVSRDRGIGLGLIIGWSAGAVMLPTIAFGLALVVFGRTGGVL